MKPGCTFDRGVSAVLKQQDPMSVPEQNTIEAAMTVWAPESYLLKTAIESNDLIWIESYKYVGNGIATC